MAKIHKTKSSLQKQVSVYFLRQFLIFIPLILIFIFENSINPILWLLIFSLFSYISIISARKYKIFNSGLKGEKESFSVLKQLPDSYHIFNNVTITDNNITNELDIVIVGGNGIFVVEIKNHNGIISGTESSSFWTQVKKPGKNSRHVNKIRNPVKQVRGQVFNLSRNLKRLGLNVWIEGLVLFPNTEAVLKTKTKNTLVFNSARELSYYIEQFVPRFQFNKRTVEKVNSWLSAQQKKTK